MADDVVIVTRKDEHVLMGAGTELAQHFMEVRGLGLVDIRAMFGIRAIRFRKRVEIVVHMELWDPEEEYTRLGMVSDTYRALGVEFADGEDSANAGQKHYGDLRGDRDEPPACATRATTPPRCSPSGSATAFAPKAIRPCPPAWLSTSSAITNSRFAFLH